MLTLNEVGKNIKEMRETKGLSVYDLEKELDISHQNQYKWEKGKSEPSIMHCIKLADFYGISLDELVGRDN